MGDVHNSAFFVTNNNLNGEYIDGVFVMDDTALFRTNRHRSQPHNHFVTHNNSALFRTNRHLSQPRNHFAAHNNSALWDPYRYYQFIDDAYVTTDDVDELIVAMQNLDGNFGSRLAEQPFNYRALLDLGDHQEEEEEEIMMMKTRTHCAKVEVDSEICCSICLCDYVNDETIGTLQCGHEYHATCIQQWLLRGKKNCPICRSPVLSSQP